MEAKEIAVGVRFVRRDGSITPPLVKSPYGNGWTYDQETEMDYDPDSELGNRVWEHGEEHEFDLMSVYVEVEEAA